MLTTTTDFPLPIVTPRLILRKPNISHKDCLQYIESVTESIGELSPWLPWAKSYPSMIQAEEYIKACNANWITKNNNNIGLTIWITEKDSDILVGSITVWNIAWNIPKFELGYWARTSKANNGYITEAVNALTQYCFLELGVKRIEVRCEIKNIRAQLVPKRLGYDLDGILRNSTIGVSDGILTDTMLFSCTDLKNVPKIDVDWGTKQQ